MQDPTGHGKRSGFWYRWKTKVFNVFNEGMANEVAILAL